MTGPMGLGLTLWGKQGGGGSGPPASFTQPYNYIWIPNLGDSRRQQGGNLSGEYGSGNSRVNSTVASNGSGIDAVLGPWLDNRIRYGETRNVGIGATRPEQIFQWPRSISASTNQGRIDNGTVGTPGNILTINTPGGTSIKPTSMIIRTMTGMTGSPKILAQLSGTTGSNGTYSIDGPAQSVSQTSTIDIAWIDTNTIAEIASNSAALLPTMAGTNGNGTPDSLVAMDTMIKGLTVPGFPYPGYRPNGESTDQPLPLYNNQPKTILLFNETRKGVDANNIVNGQQLSGADAIQFHDYSLALQLYDWNSGDPIHANTHVIVANSFNDARLADTTDTVHFDPLGGYFADGLHLSPPAPWTMAQIMKDAVGTLFNVNPSFAKLATLTNTADWLVPNSIFATKTGGTATLGTNTISLDGVPSTGTLAIPASWIWSMSGVGLNADFHYNALSTDQGNEMVIHITGTPVADTLAWLRSVSTTALKATVNLSTDTLRFSVNTKLLITAGLVVNYSVGLNLQPTTPTLNGYSSKQGLTGSSLGYGNVSTNLMYLKNSFADVSSSSYLTWVAPDVSLANNPNIPLNTTAGTMQPDISLNLVAGTAVDITLTISQPGVFKV